MHERPWAARFALSCFLLVVAACDGSDPTGNEAPLTVTTQAMVDGIEGMTYTQQVAATGGTGEYSWSVSGGALPTGLALTAGGAVSGTPSASGLAEFEVRVTDSAGQSATAELSIDVTPRLIVGTTALSHAVQGAAWSVQLEAVGGRGNHVWSLPAAGGLPWLALTAGGLLSGTPDAIGTGTVTVAVSDASGQQATAELSLTVLEPLGIVTSALPLAIQGRPYGVQMQAIGGDGAYGWSVGDGPLPAGLELTSSGALLGSPAAAGSSGFTIRVTDGGGRTADRWLVLEVEPAPTIWTVVLPSAEPGNAYTAQLLAEGGTGAYSWSLTEGGLPPGLQLAPSGLISGTPTTQGTFGFTIRVVDEAGATHTRSFTVTVAQATGLQSGIPLSGLSGDAGSTRHFVLEVPSGATQLVVSITGGTGDADLYVRRGALPQEYSYDCRPFREGNQETCTFTPPSPGPWYVMIRGHSAYAGLTLTATYEP